MQGRIQRQVKRVLAEAEHLKKLVGLGREAGVEIPGDALALLERLEDARA